MDNRPNRLFVLASGHFLLLAPDEPMFFGATLILTVCLYMSVALPNYTFLLFWR